MIGFEIASRGAVDVLRGHVSGRRITAAELRGAFDRVLCDPSCRSSVATLQHEMQTSGGYRQAADEIQRFVAARRPSPT